MASKKAVFGIIAILLSAGTLYLTLGSEATLKVDSTKTTYYINESGTLTNTGTEYVCIKETLSGVCVIKKYKPFVNYSMNDTTLLATRETEYIDGSKIVQTYYFDRTKQSVYDFPIKQDIQVINASGKYLEYKVSNLYPLDNKNKFLLYEEYILFGKNMRVSFQQKDLLNIKSSGKTKITFTLLYDIKTNDELYAARLYDPPVTNGTVGLSMNGAGLNLTAELGTNITINATDSAGIVCVDIDHHDYGVNYSCASNSVLIGFTPQDFKTNTAWGTNPSFNITYNTTGNYSVNISAHAFDDVTSNMTFSLRGYSFNGSLPSGVTVYLGDTLLYNIGRLDQEITAMNGSVNNTVHNFSSASTVTIGYIRLPALANVTNGRMSFYSGYGYTRQDITSGNVTASYDAAAFQATYAVNLTKPSGSTNKSYFSAYTGTDQTNYNMTRSDYDCWNSTASSIELKLLSTCTQTGTGPYTLNSQGALYCLNGNTSLGYGGWFLLYSASETVTNLSYSSPSVNNVYSTIYDDDYSTASQGAFYSAPGPDPNGITDQTFAVTNISSRLYEFDVVWYRYPSNTWMEIGFVNSSRDWNYTGEFNTTSKSNDLAGKLNVFLSTCTADSDGYCYAPIYLYSEGGNITVNNISINYTLPYDTVYQINETTVETYLNTKGTNFTNITLNISSSTQGIIQISNISYEYKGGNKTYTITAHNSSNGSTVYLNVTVYYSGWNYSLPRNTQYIEFMPTRGPTQKNVSAYSQNIVRPILNITARNYGGKDYDMYLAMTNVNASCANYSYAAVSNITSKTQILGNTTWYTLQENVSILENYGAWLYADYDCNITAWRLEQPTFYLRACAKGVLCSTEVS